MTSDPMPDVPPARRPGAGWPRGLAGMMVLVAAIEAGLERGRDARATPTALAFEWAHRAATGGAGTADVAVLGDSVLKFGFAPRAFERATGRRADNWATVGNPPAVALALLRAHIRAGGHPRAIVVDFKPLLVGGGATPDLNAWSRVARFADACELARTIRDPDFAIRFALNQALPSYRDRWAIRADLARTLAGGAAPDGAEVAARLRNWTVNRGGQLLPPDPGAATAAEHPNERPNLRDRAEDPGNVAAIDRIFGEAARRSIPVFWVLTPVHPRLQSGREARGLDARYDRFALDRAGRAPGRVTVVDARHLGLGPERFVDATHLDRRGALAFTAALAGWFRGLEPARPAPRWVRLEPVAEAVAEAWGADSEDTAASALAVGRGEAGPATRLR